MSQEKTEKMTTPDSQLADGKVRPKSKVKILITNSPHYNVPFVVEEVHPSLADKLIKAGKAEMAKGPLTKDQKDANKKALEDKVKERGRKPGKGLPKSEDEDLMEDLDNLTEKELKVSGKK